ncbi:LRR receptor-like serine/threonine-protein kinase, putative [Theobroma cacao]|uniref:non-specific serine/threonine protein kinase n=2 Tax=Theobroma cacao TaxID=3641 RepID=A0A061ERI2_THECC|nr:LRR receptor-like serine/threonine-protein kinase, putative [Theobroma cacao]
MLLSCALLYNKPVLNFLLLFNVNTLLLLCIITWLHSHSPVFAATTLHANETDRLALLAIKAQLTQDPLGLTSSWNDSLHFCNWSGVICGHGHQRVITLNLSYHDLVGSLSPYVGNLTFLRGISLEQNYFHGEIPPEVGRLSGLRYLNFSNNSLSGEIPANLSGCSNLIMLRLGFNKLIGKIPYQLGSLQKLERFQLHYNNLSGPIPASLGNLSSVRSLSFSVNSFEGTIPDALGQLKTLNFLGLGLNQLTGIVPPSIFNLSSITIFTLPFNQLHGNLPSNLGFALPNLRVLNIGHNQFTGALPESLSNGSNLLEFDINGSNFTGKVNIDFGGLPVLWSLVLASNPLGRGEADDLDFLNSLTKCRNLQILDLSNDQFGGVIPISFGNLSTELVQLRLGGNKLWGSIPTGIKNLVNLTELTMEQNNLTGNIPAVIGNLRMLRLLDLSENQFSGNLPSSIANISQLYKLHLQSNNFTGNIPSSFGNLTSLQDLDLSQNYLSGAIPKNVIGLSSLTISLNLAQNQLTGLLPSEVSNLKNLGHLDVSENQLSGEIPSGLGSCVTLEQIYMEGNFFEGTIPNSFRFLRGLRDLDLSRNNLSGQIPEYLQRLSLMTLNLSFNEFEGMVPTTGVFKNTTALSIVGNKKLCGGIPELKLSPCRNSNSKKGTLSRRHKFMIAFLSASVGLVLIVSLLIVNRLRKLKREPALPLASASVKKELLPRVSYESLQKATDGFSSENLIGAGSFGSVYKGILDQNENIVAVKVLYLHQPGALKSFMAECETLRNIRHRNLVKLLTACSSVDFQGNEFKALVYEFMPNGSLESWLHPVPNAGGDGMEDDLRILSLTQRANIAIDVACALEYLHHHCQKPIVHRDLKPSNILLDNDMTAHVSDFGLAKFLLEAMERSQTNQSSSAGLKGTVGYAAPEYGMGGMASTYGDIYSYGILLLEMFTGKRPTDETFKDGLDLHNFVKTALPERILEVLDPLFVAGGGGEEEEIANEGGCILVETKKDLLQNSLTEILKIGVACSLEQPRERMKLGDVIKELQLVRGLLLGSDMTQR